MFPKDGERLCSDDIVRQAVLKAADRPSFNRWRSSVVMVKLMRLDATKALHSKPAGKHHSVLHGGHNIIPLYGCLFHHPADTWAPVIAVLLPPQILLCDDDAVCRVIVLTLRLAAFHEVS